MTSMDQLDRQSWTTFPEMVAVLTRAPTLTLVVVLPLLRGAVSNSIISVPPCRNNTPLQSTALAIIGPQQRCSAAL